jgi:hypothetical protein
MSTTNTQYQQAGRITAQYAPQMRAQHEASSQPAARLETGDGRDAAPQPERMGLMDRGRLLAVIATEHVKEHRVAYSIANFIAGCAALATGHPAAAVCSIPVQQGLIEM